MGAPPPRSKAFPWLWESSCYREGMGQAWWQTPQGALLPPSHGPCWGTWGYQRPRGSRHVSVPPRGFGACRHFHSPHNTARGCYRPIGCASAITRKNQKALSLACPFLQFPSSQWPAQCTHSPRPLQRPLTQPLAVGWLPSGLVPGGSALGFTCCPHSSPSTWSLGSSPALPFRP